MTPQDITQHTLDGNPSTALQGWEVIEEATHLLRQMQFCADRGAYATGHHVAIGVDPSWHDEQRAVQVLLTCYAFGHRQVDWHGLPVFVRPANGTTVTHLVFLNARGQAILSHLPPGTYHLSTSARYGGSPEPLTDLIRPRALAGATEEPSEATIERLYQSKDGRVQATVRSTVLGTTAVAIETREANLAGARVRYTFGRQDGRVLHTAEMELSQVADDPALWEGRWEGVLTFTEPYSFVFDILPSGPGDLA